MTQELKVGDEVEVLSSAKEADSFVHGMNKLIGKVGTIEDFSEDGHIRVNFSDEVFDWYFLPSGIEKVYSTAELKEEFAKQLEDVPLEYSVGDEVRLVTFDTDYVGEYYTHDLTLGNVYTVVAVTENNGVDILDDVGDENMLYLDQIEPFDPLTDTLGSDPSGIDAVLVERGSRYGKFKEHARITQNLKRAMQDSPNWDTLPDYMKESLEMNAHKIGRILNGDPLYDDSWIDITGYADLVVKELHGESV